ncbi:hypothetical protein EOE18_17560 [Novosphingobium umbonatum]|uniref:Uncharacterized protein n=1 Tax=Novosphingobium umbonatum TaxID=1908524 RepID=A0A3S2UQR0_9SPHN|nr:hypothetical protein [Novosphingobium umbonatum]RVU02223.1 hypothetical protein EOE18_17560 [Novosphingobium umbonatum]
MFEGPCYWAGSFCEEAASRGEDQMRFGWKLTCGALLLGAIVILMNFQIQKTACAGLSDREALAILQPAFVHIKSRARPEDMGSLRLETKIHRDDNYAPDDPNSNVWVDLVDAQTSTNPLAREWCFP